jgi:hypothetical protein
MLILYDIKALVISLALAVMALFTGWGRERSESVVPIGYGEGVLSDTDK